MRAKRKVSMWFMYIIMTLVVIFLTFFIVGTISNLLIYYEVMNVNEDGPLMGVLVILSLSAISSFFFSYIIGTFIMRPIKKFQEAFKKVSEGDFTHEIDIKTKVIEIEDMRDSFNQMVQGLSSIEMLSNDFIANVSHEFKTPLAAIEAYAVLLQDDDLSKEKRHEYLSLIRKSAQDLSTLTGDVLSLSKLENVDATFSQSTFRLDEQIRNILLMNEELWESKNIVLELNLDNVTYTGSQNLIAQVWQNLINNAIKFSEDNGKIIINLKEDNERVYFEIEDFGEGISKEDLDHVFDKFYQGDSSRKSSGNGLGMSLVKRIVEINDGDIAIESDHHKGTKIKLTLKKKP